MEAIFQLVLINSKYIFIKQKEAHQQAKEIAEKGNTCVVKEYFIDDRYQKKIEKKEYNAIYQFLKNKLTKEVTL